MKQIFFVIFFLMGALQTSSASAYYNPTELCSRYTNSDHEMMNVCTTFNLEFYTSKFDSLQPGAQSTIYVENLNQRFPTLSLYLTLKASRVVGQTQVQVETTEQIPGCVTPPPTIAVHPHQKNCSKMVKKMVPAEVREFVLTVDQDALQNSGIQLGSQVTVTAVLPAYGDPVKGSLLKVITEKGNLLP